MATYEKSSPQNQEVFINFRRADLHLNFVAHLETALKQSRVNVFVNRDESIRGDLKDLLFKRIEKSRIALAIFSSKYTESSWCLDELVKIKEQEEKGNLVVLPIFYKLNPSEVIRLEGDFGSNLWNQVKRTSEFDKLKKWKEALDFVSHKTTGFAMNENSDENELITRIIEAVKRVISGVEKGVQLSKQHKDVQLSKQHKDDCMDVRFSGTEKSKRVVSATDAILWKAKSVVNPEEAEIVRGGAKMYSKSRRDDDPNPRKDEIFHGEAKPDAVLNLQKSIESKHGKSRQSSTIQLPLKHQVFINFRGEDVGFSFVSHLVSALLRKGINVFIDKDERIYKDERKGEDFGELFKKIEDSKIALVVFSRRYSESTWCLDELVKIKEHMDEGKLKVIPVFYKVEPSQVKQLNGDFGGRLWNLWRLHRDHHIIQWKEALESVASIEPMMSFWLKEDGSETESLFVTSIVEEVNKVLTSITFQEGQTPETHGHGLPIAGEKPETFPSKDPLFGIKQRMKQLEQKLEFDCNETRIVGIVGMTGIGKTTLAMMLHEKWNCKFVRCVPLLGIRKRSKDYGHVWLRTTLLKVLLGGEIPIINDETTHRSVKNELLQTKVFVILDDVSDKKQFEYLLGDLKWIKKGSKIVITTCDKSLLEGLSHDTYLVPQMDKREAFQLFSYYARDDQICSPSGTLLTRSRISVDNAGGNPLALKLMGRKVCGKYKYHSEHKLQTATQTSNTMILEVWKSYIDQLNEQQKNAFLDIVCFFKSEDEYFVRSILDSGDPDSTNAVSEVTNLADKFLITISDSRVEMNDLVYTLGKHLGSPGRYKLCKYKDIINKLGKLGDSDTNNVRGIFLNMSKVRKTIAWKPSTFSNMSNLRYLKIYDSYCPRQCKANWKLSFPRGLMFPLKEVRYLHWVKFPLEELPSDFRPDNLVDLRLPYSNIKRVWEGVKDTPRLRWVDLSHSRKLLNLSGLSKVENIQKLNLEGCTTLDELPSEIQNMKSLVFLNLRGCIRIWSLPQMDLTSLKILILSDCSNLKEFQPISNSIEFLHLDGTAIITLPPTIVNLRRLVLLNLKNCISLEFLPNSLSKLKALEELILSGCSRLKSLPDVKHSMKHIKILRLDSTGGIEMPNISSFTKSEGQASGSYIPSEWPHGVYEVSSLGRLCLSGNDFVSLQADISKLYNLKWLDVKHCKKLRSISMLPPRLEYFDAHGCGSLERVSNPLALQVLTQQIKATFNFSNCGKLDLDAKNSIISYTWWKSQLVLDALSRYNGGFVLEVRIGTCFPGWKVPAWFSYRTSGSVLKQKLPSHWCDNRFTGIGLCAVILFAGNHDQRNHLLVKCNCEFKHEDGSRTRFSFTVGGWGESGNTLQKIESSHVFVGYISRMDINKHGVGNSEEGCFCTEASLEFQVTDGTQEVVGCEVLKCGFSLVYASDEKTTVIPKRVEKPKIYRVGVELRLKQLEKLLYSTPGKTRIIGVVGEPGIGKTTLVDALFKKRGSKFPSNLFLSILKEHSTEQLRTFLDELLKNQSKIEATRHEYVKDKLVQAKSFIVLDNVSDKKQLEFLLGSLNWIKKGSKIVITTREMSFLEEFAHDTYVVPKLNNREAFQLFSYHAFDYQICSPTRTFLTLSRIFVENIGGNPLALELLGKELREKDQAHWEHKMQTITHSSNTKIQDVERFSIDQLNQQHNDEFLDIACFSRSENESFVRSLMDSGNLDSTYAISEVRDFADISREIFEGRADMNDLAYSFGEDLESCGRYMLLNYEDVTDKLKNMGKAEANNVRGIVIDMSEVTKRIALECMTFANMRNLQYLKIYDSCCPRHYIADCKLYFPDGLRFPLEEVQYLHWSKFPLEELPSDFKPENLVDLRLPYSKIQRFLLSHETAQLKWVDLSYSDKLLNISSLSKAENLLSLNLEGCTMLDELPLEIQNMKSLVYLNLRGCIRLWFPPQMDLISLKTLILTDCSSLKEFQLISTSLDFLHLDGTSIKELPPTIKNLQRLVLLNMRNCKMLEFLPNCLCELKLLEELILSGCSMLKNFPHIKKSMKHLQILLFDGIGAEEMPKISYFTSFEGQSTTNLFVEKFGSFWNMLRGVNRVTFLQRLCLSGNDFVSLQPDIGQLYHLKWLDVKHCKKLRSIPRLPPRLQSFDAHACDSLEKVANPLALLVVTDQIHATFNFSNCNKLDQEAKDSIISYTRRKSQLVLDAITRYNGGIVSEALVGTCFPGWDVPAWFGYRASGSVLLEPKLPPHWFNNRFTGIALCAVIQFPEDDDHNNLLVQCSCVFKNEDGIRSSFSCTIGGWSMSTSQRMESSHVVIGYIRRLDINKQEERCAFSKTSLEFQVTDGMGEVVVGCEVLECGFNLVYAPDERDDICWDAKTVGIANRVVNVPGEATKLLEKSLSDADIQYQSYSCLSQANSFGRLRKDDNVIYQSSNSPDPERVKNVLGEVTHYGNIQKNDDIKYKPRDSSQGWSSVNMMHNPF